MVPGSLFGLLWFSFTFIPLVMLWHIPVNPWGMAYIFAACTVFSLTSYTFKWKHWFHKVSNTPFDDSFDVPFIRILFYATSSATTISLLINLLIQGIPFTSIFTEPLVVAARIIRLRYDHELQPNFFATLFISLHYPSVILGGLFYFKRNPRGMMRVFLLTMIFLPAALSALLQGDKGSLLLVMSLFWGTLIVYKIRAGDKKICSLNELRHLLFYAIPVLFLLFFSFLSRRVGGMRGSDLPLLEQISIFFASYTSAHTYAFLDWFTNYISPDGVSRYVDNLGQYGFYTFMAIAKPFQHLAVEVPHGVYTEYFDHNNGEIRSNIYTIFRGLIADYGMTGSFFVIFVMGYLCNLVFFSLLRFKSCALPAPLAIVIVGFFCTSFIISLFIWNSPFFAIIFTSIALALNELHQNIRIKTKQSLLDAHS